MSLVLSYPALGSPCPLVGSGTIFVLEADVAMNDSELLPNRRQVNRSLTRLVAKLLVRFIGKLS